MADLIEGAVLVHLEYGDAMITGHGADGEVEIGVERKTIGDLVNSITTGRLSGHQLPGLLESYHKVYLIIEGMWKGGRPMPGQTAGFLEVHTYGGRWKELNRGKRMFRARDVWSYLTTLEATGVVVRCTYDIGHTCQMIEDLGHWWGKRWEAHRGHDMMNRVGPTEAALNVEKPSRIRSVAASLPHIGWKRSKAVVDKFRTIEEMSIATEEEWRGVEGIGGVIAKEVYKFIHQGG